MNKQSLKLWIFALIMGGITLWSFMVGDAKLFQRPELARIFFWHFPLPIYATVFLLLGAWFGYKHLSTGARVWDNRSVACVELGFLFCILTMVTGIMFSQAQWGTWWQNDPRQTSFLLVLLIYAAYFALRSAFASDQDRQGSNAATYALAALLPALFLIFVFPRLPQVQSFHPSQSIMSGQIKGGYAQVIIAMMIAFAFISRWLYMMRIRISDLEERLDNLDGQLEISSGTGPTQRVVRTVSVSTETQQKDGRS